MNKTDIANLSLLKINESSITDIDDTGDPIARKAKLLYEPTLREVLRAHFWNFAMVSESLARSTSTLEIKTSNLTIGGSATSIPPLLLAGTYNGKPFWSDTGGDYASNPTWYCGHNITGTSSAWEIWESGYPATFAGTATNLPDEVSNWTSLTGFGGSIDDVVFAASTGWDRAWIMPSDFIKLQRVLTEDGARIDNFDFRRIGGTRCLVTGDHDKVIIEGVEFVDDPNEYDPLFIQAFSTLLASRLARAVTGSEKMEADLLAAYHQLTLPDARTTDAQETQSGENHPLKEILSGSLTGTRGNWIDQD